MKDLLSGKKTYLFMAVLFVLGGLEAVGVDVPDAWFVIVAAAGGISLRAGLAKNK